MSSLILHLFPKMKSSAKILTVLVLATLLGACSNQKPRTVPTSTYVLPVKTQPRTLQPSFYMQPYKMPGELTLADVMQTYGEHVKGKLKYYFAKANMAYPPKEVMLIVFKQEKKLELWARENGSFRLIREYYVLGASGESGPKLRQGDKQVPEGIYRIVKLNPNSNYHLSMKINYPNEFDLYHAEEEGRTNLGSDIYIHGKGVSIGCVAVGDQAISELFVLTTLVGMENVKVVIVPHDPRKYPLVADTEGDPIWTTELYSILTQTVNSLSPAVKSAKTGLHSQPPSIYGRSDQTTINR